MANEDVIGPRKTMFVLVVVVGCFAMLWPKILSPLLLGPSRDQLKPNQYDRDAGCCEVLFASEVALLEIVSAVCNAAVGADGKLSPASAAACRKTVNDTCGVDIAAFLKRTENVGKTSKMLLETIKSSNSSCLNENFGVHLLNFNAHVPVNSWTHQDELKQERPPLHVGASIPALRERGRAIPAGAPTPPSRVQMPPHMRVRASPLSVYFELDIKPPPIPGLRPPLGGAGGHVPAPKSSMGVILPIYTICIIVFFVYTLSKILFKRTGTAPYEPVDSDPQFRSRVFREESRTTPDNKLVVTAISGLVAEVQQQMEASYAQNQQTQDAQDNHARPYSNGSVHNDSSHVRIVATEFKQPIREITTEIERREHSPDKLPEPVREPSPEVRLPSPEPVSEPEEETPEPKELSPEPKEPSPEPKELSPQPEELNLEPKEPSPEPKEPSPELKEPSPEPKELSPEPKELIPEPIESSPEKLTKSDTDLNLDIMQLTETGLERVKTDAVKATEGLLNEEIKMVSTSELEGAIKQSTSELLEEALEEESSSETDDEAVAETSSVKVLGMEMTAHPADGGTWPDSVTLPLNTTTPSGKLHEAEDVKSIYLETDIPQQSKVLVADFAEDRSETPEKSRHSPLVVSGKMTLSLIPDNRETPERDLESTMTEDFTTASALTQPAAEPIEEEEDASYDEEDLEEEVEEDEEIEVEEIIEEVSEEEEEQ